MVTTFKATGLKKTIEFYHVLSKVAAAVAAQRPPPAQHQVIAKTTKISTASTQSPTGARAAGVATRSIR